ncbi:bifunctional glutamine synthetase adenylyltransferase/deadenyltransferase [Vibrio sp. UCD-FRSSP16_10]|uniref:bifunctional [glutamate--ammonia ligase]-adenylyl-L-tyrosine phosphorylase/[glutamate--ammonia-ligase] adenylyltransferase n=1 Tax=unclassified Vibrio TaxID=2614977 RepID=UPI0007FC307B|nr:MULTISPECIES: bifunctional [glutamate--ammonia ligase]-adenylyl-L-tyrosine phosphorylase/[glutamate--ammonia-ligase] adenylyltransferase [unclassified Vibrio]OBT07370.1 bifunctional glutamine synthetase adenylyltransferase/deadenyltransferase [Vibrio sp. UCD-FRSSP16_30]OBT12849.1 bifunctional glutamine synthetase adenylyltransferase/deadenyltransferase [Vibrio sp. UCD-FRSSP16_10]
MSSNSEQATVNRYQQLISKFTFITELWPQHRLEELDKVINFSAFIFNRLLSDEALLKKLPEMLDSAERCAHYRTDLNQQLAQCLDENSIMQELRAFRNHEIITIAWRDIVASWSVEESLCHVSELAEAMIFESYAWQYADCSKLWGTPKSADGTEQPMLVIGMGKLGGGELNFSSDIDLIFTYPENGETEGVRRSISNAQFFTRLGQRLIKSLDQVTLDGFCYRVDMRLRPFGESGPLVMSFAALEDYYQEQGRDWERYAMVKARVMGREMYPQYQELRQMLRPFVFRRYIDFSAIQSLRRMKAMIRSEVRRRGLTNNIKLGPGGIREIEFIAQVFQLIRGGREPSLRGRGLLETLEAIKQQHLLEPEDVDGMRSSYCFLRRLENLLQAMEDKQTQTLPDDSDNQQKLASVMGFATYQQLQAELSQHMANVHQVFEDLIGDEEENGQVIDSIYQELWSVAKDPEQVIGILHELSLDVKEKQLSDLSNSLCSFKAELGKKTLGPRGREVVRHLMPKLIYTVLSHPEGEFGLERVLTVLSKIVTRTTYLELLDEHPAALEQLVKLCTASPMITELLGRYPILLDELLDPLQLYKPVELSSYKSELRDYLARIPEEDMEQQMEALRQFKQTCILRIAAADITGVLPVMQVSDHLTYLAEAIVEQVVNQAWRQMAEKYGDPNHLLNREGRGFAVLGYGKVGGWELGYNSDLDIVFVHDCPLSAYTDGAKSIDGRQFYLRLAQRITHLFSTRTASGILYEIDTRLRPSGASGLMVSPIDSYEEYQLQEAWTWEHQAIVRARPIYGDNILLDAFAKVRKTVLCLPREQDQLRTEVVKMREKMRDHLGSKKKYRFMLKQDHGGITDIEFLTQYWVLNYSHKDPSLSQWSDNVRILQSLVDADLLSAEQSTKLIEAYTSMRNEIHRRNLLNLDADVAEDKFVEQRKFVSEMWCNWMNKEQQS